MLKKFCRFVLLAAGGACRPVRRWTASKTSARRPSWRRWAIPPASQIVAAIPAPAPITHVDNSLWQPGAHSFFHDPRASHVGDVITVNVSVADAAKLSEHDHAHAAPIRDDANLTNFFGLEKALPSQHGSGQPGQDGLGQFQCRHRLDPALGSHQPDPGGAGRPGAAQRQPGDRRPSAGAGEQRAARHAASSGIVRREDITQDNTVDLSQIAEARITYGGKGTVSDVQQPRYGCQLFDILMPW